MLCNWGGTNGFANYTIVAIIHHCTGTWDVGRDMKQGFANKLTVGGLTGRQYFSQDTVFQTLSKATFLYVLGLTKNKILFFFVLLHAKLFADVQLSYSGITVGCDDLPTMIAVWWIPRKMPGFSISNFEIEPSIPFPPLSNQTVTGYYLLQSIWL